MPWETPTLKEILQLIASDIESRLEGVDPSLRRSFLHVLARAFSGALHGHYGFLNYISRQVFPDTAEAEFLRRWAKIWGIVPSPAWPAKGNVKFSGTDSSVIEKGTVVKRGDGIQYATVTEVTIVNGSAIVEVEALSAGADTNAGNNNSLSLIEPITGVLSTVNIESAGLTGGMDEEDDSSLLNRLLRRIQQPPHGGAAHDYVDWALDRKAHGVAVTRAWLYPHELGIGTITLRFMMDDTYQDGIPQSADLTTIKDYIESQRPATADLFVPAPIAQPLNPVINDLNPSDQTVKNAIEAELRDLLRRESIPGGKIQQGSKIVDVGPVLITHIREAISTAAGEHDHNLVTPNNDILPTTGNILTVGEIDWGE